MIYQHLPTISEKMNTLEDILRKFIGCLRFIHYITAWANFHFPHPCPTLSACQEDSVDEAEVEVGTFQPSQVIQVVLATPISNSNPSTCYMYFPATLAIRATCICPTSMNTSPFQRCRFWLTNLGACRLQCQCQVHVTKWRLRFSPDIFSVSRWFLRNSCSFSDGGLILLFGGFIL